MALHDIRTPIDRPLDHVDLGVGVGPELDRRLIGNVRGRRVLDLGCGAGHTAVGLARRGARVIAVEHDRDQLDAARALAADHGVTIEFHQAQPAELAFLPGDHVDLVVSVTALSFVEDLDRVARQVHRVTAPAGHFLCTLPHPATMCADPDAPAETIRDWSDTTPLGDRWVHTAEQVVTALVRANFFVDTLLERGGDGPVPATLVIRGRKLGQ